MVNRGLQRSERFGVDTAFVSASATLVAAPCLVYGVTVTLANTNATGDITLADSTASAAMTNETAKKRWNLGAGGASAMGGLWTERFTPPWKINNTLVCSAAGAAVSVQYIAQ